ncbi:MAG: hypothetical protein ACM3ML_35870 [Micromonosporaceae bacterium]
MSRFATQGGGRAPSSSPPARTGCGFEIAERRAGDAGATATALLWFAGNAGGLAVALIVQVLVKEPAAAFAVMASAVALSLPLTVARRVGTLAPAGLGTAGLDAAGLDAAGSAGLDPGLGTGGGT